jgi:hypothetical protein
MIIDCVFINLIAVRFCDLISCASVEIHAPEVLEITDESPVLVARALLNKCRVI